MPFTFNGFPYGDFHQSVVKHRVYEPTWADAERLAALAATLPADQRDVALLLGAQGYLLHPSDQTAVLEETPVEDVWV